MCRTTLRVPGSGSSSTRAGANTAGNLSWSFRNENQLTTLCFPHYAGTPCCGRGFGDEPDGRRNCDPDDGYDLARQSSIKGYAGMRRYVLENQKFHKRAEMLVQVQGDNDGTKHFEVVSQERRKA